MTGFRTMAVPLVALAFAGCAGPTDSPPDRAAASVPAPAAKPKYKKPPRMNGRGELSSISLDEFFALHQAGKVLVYDARPAFLFGLGHIPGAIHLPKDGCDEAIAAREPEIKAALASGKTIVTYCSSITCPDGHAIASHISGFGYPARIFSGGWSAWKDAGLPTE